MRFVVLAVLISAALAACSNANGRAAIAGASPASKTGGQSRPLASSEPSKSPEGSQEAEAEPSAREAAGGSDVSFPGAQAVTYTATDFAFGGPARIPGGPTTIRLVNAGQEVHHLTLLRLTGGKTADDLARTLRSLGPEDPLPSWAVEEGGPNAVAPGGQANATAVLEPGTYVAICFVPSPDGMPHFAKGMLRPVEVSAGQSAKTWTEPRADLTVRLVEYTFELPETVSAGRHVIRVENTGQEPHELTLWQLAPGRSAGDLLAWAAAGFKSRPPAMPAGGISGLAPGGHQSMVTDLKPGDYALLCFVPDDEDGKMHIEHGMVKELRVE